MVRTPPGSLSEGAAERSEAEGVYFDERNRLKNFRANKSLCVNRWPGGTIGRHSLSQPLRAASSLREGAGNGCGSACHSTGYSRNCEVAGDFHRPYGDGRPAQKSNGFDRVSSPGGSGNQRIRTISMRHCPAALPPNTKKTGGGSRLSLQVIFRTGRKSCRSRPRRCARQRGPWADRAWS